MSSTEPHRARLNWIAIAVGLAATLTLFVHARSYPPLTFDDAFISLRYAQRLLEGRGLTWTDGPPVEGYSNLLWVLGCALLGALGVDLQHTPLILGATSAIAIVAAVVYAFRPGSWRESLPAFAGAMFMALAGPIALWAVAGLEGCLVGALLAWSLVLLRPLVDGETSGCKSALRPGIPLALLCLTRPDGPLLTVAVCAFLLLRARSRDAVVTAIVVGLLPALATLGQVAFRLAYYGDFVPNTARAKVAFTAARLESGVACVADAGRSSYGLWIPAAFALFVAWRDPKRRSWILFAAGLFAVWGFYVSSITCQSFGYRMLIPCYVLLAFLVAEMLDWAQQQGKTARIAAWVLALAMLALFGRAQQRDKNIAIARWSDPPISVRATTIGKTLGAAFEEHDPLVAVDAAGVIPYYSELRSLDMLGLNDAHIARQHGDSFGQGVQGHELGDGAYVLSQEPDIIVAGVTGSSRLAFRGGREMDADPRFHAWYRRVRMVGDDPVPVHFNIYCRLEGRVGIERANDRLTIPGFLFAAAKGTQARIDEENRLVMQFVAPVQTTLAGIELAAGTWQIRAVGEGALRLSAQQQSNGVTAAPTRDGVELVMTEPGLVDITVTGAAAAFVSEVVAERTVP